MTARNNLDGTQTRNLNDLNGAQTHDERQNANEMDGPAVRPMGKFLGNDQENPRARRRTSLNVSLADEPASKNERRSFSADERQIIHDRRAEQLRSLGKNLPNLESTRRWINRNPQEAANFLNGQAPEQNADQNQLTAANEPGDQYLNGQQQPVLQVTVDANGRYKYNLQEVARIASERNISEDRAREVIKADYLRAQQREPTREIQLIDATRRATALNAPQPNRCFRHDPVEVARIMGERSCTANRARTHSVQFWWIFPKNYFFSYFFFFSN